MNASSLFAGETAMLHLLLAELMTARPGRFALAQLGKRQQDVISSTYFLLDGEPRHNTEHFVTYTLGQLIEQLGRETQRPFATYIGQVRGQVNWPATVKARYADDYHPGRFVCREVRRDYDTPQNQLLKYLVEQIYDCLQAVPRAIRQGACYFALPTSGGLAQRPVPTAARLDRMEAALGRARLHAGYREITTPVSITADHMRAAALAREESFVEVVAALKRYDSLRKTPERAEALAAAGHCMLPLPGQAGGPGELWIKLAVAILRGELAEE